MTLIRQTKPVPLKKCSHKSCEQPWKPSGKFNKDKSKPDGLCLFCKDCLKEYRDKKKYPSSQQHKRVYRKVRIKAPELKLRQCIGYAPDGSRCKTMSNDYFCPRCKAIKRARETEHYIAADFGVGDLMEME